MHGHLGQGAHRLTDGNEAEDRARNNNIFVGHFYLCFCDAQRRRSRRGPSPQGEDRRAWNALLDDIHLPQLV